MTVAAAEEEGLRGLWFAGQKYFARGLDPIHEEREVPVFTQTRRWLDDYFSGKIPDFTPPLCLAGTDFQRAVWEILLTVPYGRTVTYGEIGERLAAQRGLPHMSARAVGGGCALSRPDAGADGGELARLARRSARARRGPRERLSAPDRGGDRPRSALRGGPVRVERF